MMLDRNTQTHMHISGCVVAVRVCVCVSSAGLPLSLTPSLPGAVQSDGHVPTGPASLLPLLLFIEFQEEVVACHSECSNQNDELSEVYLSIVVGV